MERPVGVTIIAVLYFLGTAFFGLCGLLFFVGGSLLSSMAHSGSLGPGSALFAMGGAVIGAIFLVIALIELAIGIGFIKLQNWARVTAIIFTGIAVLFGVLGMLSLLAHLVILLMFFRVVVLAIQVRILYYLFQPHVKQAFGATSL